MYKITLEKRLPHQVTEKEDGALFSDKEKYGVLIEKINQDYKHLEVPIDYLADWDCRNTEATLCVELWRQHKDQPNRYSYVDGHAYKFDKNIVKLFRNFK